MNYSSTESSESETQKSPPPQSSKMESKSRDSDRHTGRHRKKDRHHEKKHSKHHKRRSSRDDRDRSKRRHRDDDDDDQKRKDRDRKDSRSDRRRSRDREDRDKYGRRDRHEEKKHKSRHRSKSRERYQRRRSSSSSDRERKIPPKLENHIMKPSPAPSFSSSPQKSPMISLGNSSQNSSEPKVELQLPSYYNPAVINVNKFAEQQKKRKLIWSSKKDEPAKDAAKWGGAKFAQDVDGTKASKFMRLMGIKDAPKPEATAAAKPSDDLFNTMEHQYEVARQVTHISRGVGLGFGSKPF